MSIEQDSSAAVKSKVELLPSIGLWAKSWAKSLINLLAASFGSWQELQQRLLAFQSHYERSASPFNWTFTRRDLNALLAKIALRRLAHAA